MIYAPAANALALLAKSTPGYYYDANRAATLSAGALTNLGDLWHNANASATGANLTYSANGAPNGNAYWQTNGVTNALRNSFVMPTPGTTNSFVYQIFRLATADWLANRNIWIGGFGTGNGPQVFTHTSVSKIAVYDGTIGADTDVGNSWVRLWVKFTGGATTQFKVGSDPVTTGDLGNVAPGSGGLSCFWGAAGTGSQVTPTLSALIKCAWAMSLHVTGVMPSANQITQLDNLFLHQYGSTVLF